MIFLEKLYNSAEQHLSGNDKAWNEFANDFKIIFGSGVILYRIDFEPDRSVKLFEPIATSDPEIVKKYIKQKMYLYHPMSESDMPPFEPSRRTDVMSDEEFKKLGKYADMMIELGVFYLIIVPAQLPDGTFIGLVGYREEEEGDFSVIDKQRLALFMRHLMVFVDPHTLILSNPQSDIVVFGTKYNLTEAEVQILSALLEGHSLRQIAEETNRTYGTIRWHVQNILEKCQVDTQKNLLREFYLLIKN